MAGEEPAEGSQSRSRMDLNFPPLPRPPYQLCGVIMDGPEPAQLPEMPIAEVPRTDEVAGLLAPEETPLQPAVYSSSNALSMIELSAPELSLLDPMIIEWLDSLITNGGEGLDDAGEPAATPSNDGNVLSPVTPPLLPTVAGLEEVGPEWVDRLLHPLVVPPVVPVEMVSTTRGHDSGATEEMTSELRLQRLSQLSEQHRIVSPGPMTRNQRATSPEEDRLVQVIKESHSSLVASRGVLKFRNCGCNSSFWCNICLKAAKEPVVTPCGHIFCWPCLYQWLHQRSVHPECPVCKGEVLERNITPVYVSSSDDERGASNTDIPPRPRANTTQSMRQHLQTPDPTYIANMLRWLLQNQQTVRANSVAPEGGVEVNVPPAARTRASVRRQQRQDNLNSPSQVLLHMPNTPSPTLQHGSNAAPQGAIQVTVPSSSANNDALAISQQSSSMEQASTSSTVAVIVGEAAQGRRSRPSESTTTRRTRRRRQQ